MYGARAVQKQINEAYPHASLAVHIIWLPMIPTDDERSAREAARMFTDARVTQYYDPKRLSGLAYMQEAFSNCLREALAATPKDHPVHDDMEAWARESDEPGALWDAALFYDQGITWNQRAPAPTLWSKQVGYFGCEASAGVTGTFFKNECAKPPVDSDWNHQIREALATLLDRGR